MCLAFCKHKPCLDWLNGAAGARRERTAEILADERVQAAAARSRAEREREPAGAAADRAGSNGAAPAARGAPASGNGAGAGAGGAGAPAEAREWSKDWRARSLERALPQDEPVGSAAR